jgi:hypothetical protein
MGIYVGVGPRDWRRERQAGKEGEDAGGYLHGACFEVDHVQILFLWCFGSFFFERPALVFGLRLE